jgi:hypothetical protein
MDLEDTLNQLFRQLTSPSDSLVRRWIVRGEAPFPREEIAAYRRRVPTGIVVLRRIVLVPSGRNARATVTPAGAADRSE